MPTDEIKKLLGTENLIIGTERTTKMLKKGDLKKIFLAKNASEETKKDIDYYAELSGVEVETLNETNEEIGTLCKKPFSISVIGMK